MGNGEMWCYQKPGFEALLLAELQRQQQCNQFCDTLLKTDGVSVPVHSCILSAISPQISSSLSSMPPPHAGWSRFLEFQALGSSTLLQLVKLLYSGQMAGEGEEERREAVSAAARLGIHGLVEVTKERNETAEGQHKEAGVQTEPVVPLENEERQGRWRKEVSDGDTFLWREKVSQGEKDTWTQTEELQVNTAPASFETIDMGTLQTLGQTDPNLLQTQIPHIPVSLVCPPNSNQNQVTLCVDPKSWWTGAEEMDDEHVEQFQGNISGYINYILNPHKEEGRCPRGRPRGRRSSRTRGVRRAGVGERGTRRPRASTGGRGGGRGRGRGGLTQTVDVQTVGVSKIQKMFLQRGEIRMPRTGQGGGAVGRKLNLKTRELLKQTKNCPRRRRRYGKEWEFSQSQDVTEAGESNLQQGGLYVQREINTPTTSASFSSPAVRFNNAHQPFPPSSSTLQPSSSLLSHAASYQHPASALTHSTPLPPPNPPPNEPEHIDRLLEEVMMGLNILPNKTKQQDHTTVLLETGPRHVGGVGCSGGRGTSGSSVPALQQQGEGEFNDMLENFLQSFEHHVESCSTREETEKDDQSCSEAVLRKCRKTRSDKTGSLQSFLQVHTISQDPKKSAKETATRVKAPPTRRRRRINQFAFPSERKRVRVKKPALTSEAKERTVPNQGDEQLLQMPVVKLERSGLLPESVTLQRRCCQSLEERPAPTKSRSLSVKYPHGGCERKVYPIRSRFKDTHVMETFPFLHDSPPNKQHPSTDKLGLKQGNPKKNKQLGRSHHEEDGSLSPVQQQLPVCEHVEENQTKQGEGLNVQTNAGLQRTAKKRGVESDEETSSDPTETKRLRCVQLTHTSSASAGSAPPESEDVNMSVRDGSQNDCEDEEIVVYEEDEDDCHQAKRESTSFSYLSPSPSSCGEDIEEDIDVIGDSSPAPDPVIIRWSDSSGGEEEEGKCDEDVDVVEE